MVGVTGWGRGRVSLDFRVNIVNKECAEIGTFICTSSFYDAEFTGENWRKPQRALSRRHRHPKQGKGSRRLRPQCIKKGDAYD